MILIKCSQISNLGLDKIGILWYNIAINRKSANNYIISHTFVVVKKYLKKSGKTFDKFVKGGVHTT